MFELPNKFRKTSITCLANSLVGVTIRAQCSFELRIFSITGIANAPVFPVPVEADPRISLPLNIIGMALD